jgi:pyruvate dehydrogenase E1 component beta subunit
VNYIQTVNKALHAAVETARGPLVVFGQNVSTGSRIGGLTAGIDSAPGRTVVNMPNIENAEVGMGLGLMLQGVSSVFVMKQQDFLLLGIDQLANTYNVLRGRDLQASFTILTIVVDSGYEGPQSCFNCFSDICSISRVPGFAVTNRRDIERVFARHTMAPGLRIIGVSQRMFRQEAIDLPDAADCGEGAEIFSYGRGNDATIVAFNFAMLQALEIADAFRADGSSVSLFSVNAMLPSGWKAVLDDVKRTQRLIVVDDSKSVNRTSDRLLAEAASVCPSDSIVAVRRQFSEGWYRPNADTFNVEPAALVAQLRRSVQDPARRGATI